MKELKWRAHILYTSANISTNTDRKENNEQIHFYTANHVPLSRQS